MTSPGRLLVVSTPIGNLGDMTPRAVESLRGAAVVVAEDTRHSRPLLERFDVATPMLAYHEHNEARLAPELVRRMVAGETVAIITDAGTPIVSDPGARLTRLAAEAGVPVVPIPGASAVLAALVASAIPADRFTFYGFPPRKGRERRELLDEVVALRHAAVLYEAPGRVGDTLADLAAAGAGERDAAVARELTKQFEEVRRGTVADLARYYAGTAPRGEVVIVVAGAPPPVAPDEAALRERAVALRADGLGARDVAAALARDHGASRNVAYRIAHEGEES